RSYLIAGPSCLPRRDPLPLTSKFHANTIVQNFVAQPVSEEIAPRPCANPPSVCDVTHEGECPNDGTRDYANRPRLAEPRGLLRDEETADSGHPAGEEVAHRFLRGPIRFRDWAVVSRDRESTSLRVEVDNLGATPSREGGRIDDLLRPGQCQR